MENSLLETTEQETIENNVEEKIEENVGKDVEEKIEEKPEKDINDYGDYKPDSRYKKFYDNDDKTKNNLKEFNKLAKENNFSKEQHKAILDYLNGFMEKVGIFDTRSDAEKKLEQEEWLKKEKEKLGEDADHIINSNVEFVNNFGMLNEEQKDELLKFMAKDAISCSIVNVLRNCLVEDKNIPTNLNIGGLPDDYTLAKEYNNPETSDRRREEILRQRIEAGRTGFLPLVD